MPYQTTMNRPVDQYHQPDKPTQIEDTEPISEMGSSIASFSGDVVSLIELQLSLLSADFRDFLSGSIIPLVMIVFGSVLALGAFPVALYALGDWMHNEFSWSLAAGLAAAAGIGVVVALLLSGLAGFLIVKNLKYLKRSRYELKRNMNWIKQVVSSR